MGRWAGWREGGFLCPGSAGLAASFRSEPAPHEVNLKGCHQDEDQSLKQRPIEGMAVVVLVHGGVQVEAVAVSLLLHADVGDAFMNAMQDSERSLKLSFRRLLTCLRLCSRQSEGLVRRGSLQRTHIKLVESKRYQNRGIRLE